MSKKLPIYFSDAAWASLQKIMGMDGKPSPTLNAILEQIELQNEYEFQPVCKRTVLPLPVAVESIPAGFPSPAQDYIDKNIDLNEFLITNHNSTFMVRVDSLSMLNAGLDVGDYLVVDRSLEPQHRDIVIACIDNDYFTVKRLINDVLGSWLKAENEGYEDIHPAEGQQFEIWGVVTNVIKKFR